MFWICIREISSGARQILAGSLPPDYGIIAPLLHGVTNIIDEGDFDAERWYNTLEKQKVNVWYTAPTAIRMLMRLPGDPRSRFDLSRLRLIASVGEPLNPSAVTWGQRTLGLPIHDNWWQTETGGIMIANYPSMEIRPGSIGKPLPGVEAAILRRSEGGALKLIDQVWRRGRTHIENRAGPPCFAVIFTSPNATQKCFAKDSGGEDWYLYGGSGLAATPMVTSPVWWAAPTTSSKTAGHHGRTIRVEKRTDGTSRESPRRVSSASRIPRLGKL